MNCWYNHGVVTYSWLVEIQRARSINRWKKIRKKSFSKVRIINNFGIMKNVNSLEKSLVFLRRWFNFYFQSSFCRNCFILVYRLICGKYLADRFGFCLLSEYYYRDYNLSENPCIREIYWLAHSVTLEVDIFCGFFFSLYLFCLSASAGLMMTILTDMRRTWDHCG